MDTASPLWLTIVLAVLAPASAVGAAWYSAYRADRRWRHEFDVQEARWRRETELAEARYWRDRRSKRYAEMLSIWREMNERFATYSVLRDATKVDQQQLDDARDQLLVIGKKYRDTAAEVAVEASHPVSGLCKVSSSQVSQFLALIMEDYNLAEGGPRATKDELQGVVAQLVLGHGQFDQQVRTELGVPEN